VKSGKKVRELFTGDYFGESAILFEMKRSLSVIAQTKTVCFQIATSSLIENLGENYRSIILSCIVKDAFNKSKYLKLLIFDNYFTKIYPNFKIFKYKNNQVVINKNDINKKIVIIIEGNLVQVKLILLI
jgi:hypothetical protein